eukprot:TRINITY_DN14951_c1_g5_i1.p1 TRINITY_DN14951_c1_g5~~TRINITY_DN14951_c1_g5_i1.p1  ORF type:complete len:1291 (+),score=193.15 TRINITY_DN14951_c1_g5_i1:68-3874(+)
MNSSSAGASRPWKGSGKGKSKDKGASDGAKGWGGGKSSGKHGGKAKGSKGGGGDRRFDAGGDDEAESWFADRAARSEAAAPAPALSQVEADISDLRVTGVGDIPAPWKSFAACKFSRQVMSALAMQKFPAPTPIQACCWPVIMTERDVVGVAKTGSGKTLAFVTPSFDWMLHGKDPRHVGGPLTLVLAPTRELAVQINDEADKLAKPLGLRTACIYGGQQWDVQCGQLKRNPHFIVACPGRLLDMVEKRRVWLGGATLLVLDEADRMLDMGFEPQVRAVIDLLPSERQTIMFTATWPPKVVQLAKDFMRSPIQIQIGSTKISCNSSVAQEIRLCGSQGDKLQVLLEILRGAPGERIIVFVNQKITCAELCADLNRWGIEAVALHGDLEQADRDISLDAFKSGRTSVAVATDVAARGLDIKDVKAVVCYDVALDKETHVHRVGRTGRAGATGKAVTLIRLSEGRDVRMCLEVFELMEEIGQTVDSNLRAQVKQAQYGGGKGKNGAGKGGNKGQRSSGPSGPSQVEVESSDSGEDEDGDDEHAKNGSGAQGSGVDGSQATASVAQALSRGTAYLRNPVEELLGHATARDVADQVVVSTVQSGWRMLTHDLGSGKKPYRWMVFRCLDWSEIEELCPGHAVRPDASIPEFVWHVAVLELEGSSRRRNSVTVVNQYFQSNMDVIFDTARDMFASLDEDDPQLIEAAVDDHDFCQILRCYFEAGDIRNPAHFLTLARTGLWPEGSLLHTCCEQGFAQCVDLLLERYTPYTAPESEPWLQLADPLWQESSWGNTAFHSAAWHGHHEVMSSLVAWATKHDQLVKVRSMRNKQRQTMYDLVTARLEKCKQNGKGQEPLVATYNVIAKIFGKKPMSQAASHEDASQQNSVIVLIDSADKRRILDLPSSALTLDGIADTLASVSAELAKGAIDTVLLLRINVQPSQNDAAEAKAASRLLELLAGCRRVVFMKSSSSPMSAVHLCRSMAKMLSAPDDYRLRWHSLALVPRWTEEPAGGLPAYAEALEEVLAALRGACGILGVTRIDLPPGSSSSYLPWSSRHLPVLLSAILRPKSVAHHLLGDGPQAWKETELWSRMSAKFTSQNPLLSGPVSLERRLFHKPALLEARNVSDCLHPAWSAFVESYVDSLASTVRLMPQWAPRAAHREVAAGEEALKLVQRMADEALLYLLKMRRSRTRPGLPGLENLVRPAFAGGGSGGGPALFPRAREYFNRKVDSKRAPKGDAQGEEAPPDRGAGGGRERDRDRERPRRDRGRGRDSA